MDNKTGIITFQNANNYGAVLQAFALQTTLEKLGNNVEIINYDSPEMQLKSVQTKLFSDFNHKYLNLSGEYTMSSQLELDGFDLLVAGSDQIWNPAIAGCDEAYFFRTGDVRENESERSKPRIVSYAASIGLTGDHLLPYKDFFKKNLEAFEKISIRESAQKEYLENLTGKKVSVNIDPTLLLDKEEYEKCFGVETKDEKYILLYTNNINAKIMDFVNLLSAYTGMKVISVSMINKHMFVDGTIAYDQVSPVDWVKYIAGASMVVTDSFHGLMFSLIFEKPFYSYTKRYSNISRVTDVLENCNLKNRTLKNLGAIKDISFDIDFTGKRNYVSAEKIKSLNYLKGLM